MVVQNPQFIQPKSSYLTSYISGIKSLSRSSSIPELTRSQPFSRRARSTCRPVITTDNIKWHRFQQKARTPSSVEFGACGKSKFDFQTLKPRIAPKIETEVPRNKMQ